MADDAKLVKLTKAQEELLREAAKGNGQRCAKNYSTAFVLKRIGLVTITEVDRPFAWIVTATPAGRAHPAATT